tara:strand:+ start:39 stop:524 length:486 start_codon:yes stop_codon:yes gene_type:complete
MDELLLSIGFFLQVLSVIWIIFLIRDRRAKKRIKEKLSKPTIDLDEGNEETGQRVVPLQLERTMSIQPTIMDSYDGGRLYPQNTIRIPIEKKEDFIPKKRIRAHKLEKMGPLTKSGRPDMRYSANRGDRGNIADGFMEDVEYVGAPLRIDWNVTTDNEFPF